MRADQHCAVSKYKADLRLCFSICKTGFLMMRLNLFYIYFRRLSQEEYLIKEFVKMDKNQDGKISPGEFDNDLK